MSAHRMTNADAAWLHMDRPTNLMVVNALLFFDEPLDIDRTREVVRTRLVERFPRFRRRIAEPRLGIGLPSWEDDPDFDLDLHVHRLALPAPADKAALQALVSDLVVRPLDRARPLWDMYAIEGYRGGTAVLTRMHHCIADGIALARVLLSLTDSQPDAGLAPPAAEHGDGTPLSAVTGVARAGAHAADAVLHESAALAAHPRPEVARLIEGATANGRALAKLLLTGADEPSVLRGKLGVARHVRWTEPIELADVKAIGHATGTTVNDVLLSAMSGALHRYLAARDSDVGEIRAMVPFNLRPLDEPLPRDLGNRFGLVYLALPVGIEDPGERLAEMHRRMDAIKHSPEGPLSYAILGLIGSTPVPVEQRLIGLFTPKTTAVMTNVPGPREPVYFAGSRVAGVLGWVPAGGEIGMGVSIFSYAGGVTVGLQVDAGLVPDPEPILDAFGEELAALATLGRR
ncbi:MAG TPA: wax ester/triacylglycerol synthase family O-acyltransferase, partial [Solirubrobacteraceae bacterium]|nr:wax ester/triacylglycerol synthase family O-acyltransferase [Solirubrobacteraceae bacterium]